jgi:hypothetical protein
LTVVEAGGEVVVQASGGYSTGFTITQSVTIDSAGFNASVISTSAGNLCSIAAGATDRVVLRGISFHGASVGGNAITVSRVGALYVEHCSVAEFTQNGVQNDYGGSLQVIDTDVRACFGGIEFTAGLVPANLIVRNSRFTECGSTGVVLVSLNAAAAGSLTNCIASRCGDGFVLFVGSSANADLTLVNCKAFSNDTGISVRTDNGTAGRATLRIANCVVTQNQTGIARLRGVGGGTASVLGTSPGSNLVFGNVTDGASDGSVVLQ